MPGKTNLLRRRKKKEKKGKTKGKKVDNELDEIDMLMAEQEAKASKLISPKSVSKSGQPIISAFDGGDYNPSLMRSNDDRDPVPEDQPPNGTNVANKKRTIMLLKEPPTAKDSAFSGPPRFDWIDIETAAVIKIQAIFRRNKVLDKLANSGKETARMRNRKRERQAKRKDAVSDDVPFFLSFCGIGYLFGDASAEDEEVSKMKNAVAYQEKRNQSKAEEESKRRFRWRKKDTQEIVEGFEVVDNIER